MKKPKTKPDAKQPAWLKKTPDGIVDDPYRLEMWDSNQVIQEIELSRDEFTCLKRHLADMRGYNLEGCQRALLTEFAGIVQNMPAAKVRPLVDLLTAIRGQNYVNTDIFELIRSYTNMDARESLAQLVSFFELTGKLTELHAEQLGKLLSRIGEHGEKSMYRTIAFEIKTLKEGIQRGAAFLASPTTPRKQKRSAHA